MCFWSHSHKLPCAYCVDIVTHALNIGISSVAYTLISSPRRLVYLADWLFWANKTLNSKQQIAKLICGLSKYFFTFVQVSQDYFIRDYGFSGFSLRIFPPTHFRQLILLLAGAQGGTSARTLRLPTATCTGTWNSLWLLSNHTICKTAQSVLQTNIHTCASPRVTQEYGSDL